MLISRRTALQGLSFGSALLASHNALAAGGAKALRSSSPAAEGVAAKGIRAFLDAINGSKHDLHSFMMLRHGRAIAQGWWNPYRPTDNHGMYSMSKSFTSTAIGFAVAEGRLQVGDKVVSFFPDDLPAKPDKQLSDMTVKHLLTMSTGQDRSATGATIKSDNWVRNFLAQPIPDAPGSVFNYNSAATYMLSAIVQKLTGQRVVDYLKPRLFDPLGVEGPTWETCPLGINTGGWGLNIRTEGLARLGQLYLQQGRWNGSQILPPTWITEATSKQIQQPINKKSNPDWIQGYGYQFWRCRHDGFRGDGAFGQYTIVLPKQDVVIAMTGESPSMQDELNLIWQHLLPAIDADTNRADDKALKKQLAALAVPAPSGRKTSPAFAAIVGKKFSATKNDHGLQSFSFASGKGRITLGFTDANGTHQIPCGLNEWIRSAAPAPFGTPRIIAGGAPDPGTPYRIAARAAWRNDHELELTWRYFETPHSDLITCRFEGDRVTLTPLGSITHIRGGKKDPRAAVTATAQS